MAIGRVDNIYIVPPPKKDQQVNNEQRKKHKKNKKEDEEVGQFEELFGTSYETILLDFLCSKEGTWWLSPKSIQKNIGANTASGTFLLNPAHFIYA